MAEPVSNLYELLEVPRNATSEEIRKAYRKQALRTHPDRFTNASEKKSAEEAFRAVNAAYEVLNDPNSRKLYDEHGVWPPPAPGTSNFYDDYHHRHREEPRQERFRRREHRSHHHHQQQHDTHPEPMFSHDHGFPRFMPHFPFTDPFALFDSVFPELHRMFSDPDFMFANPQAHFGPSLLHPPMPLFPSMMPMFGPSSLLQDFPHFPETTAGSQRPTLRYEASSSSRGWFGSTLDHGEPMFVSENRMTRVVNGQKQSIWQRIDSKGNEHCTYTYPDGSERYTLNGVEQPSGQSQRLPPPPPFSQIQPGSSSQGTTIVPPPPIIHTYAPRFETPPPPPPSLSAHSKHRHSQRSHSADEKKRSWSRPW